MNNQEKFQKDFAEALQYVHEVINQFARSRSEEEDLIQEFSLMIFSQPEKYAQQLDDNRNVYMILRSISKSKYKMNSRDVSINEQILQFEPDYNDETDPDTEADIEQYDVSEKQRKLDQIESILYKMIKTNQISYERQVQILNAYQRPISITEFAREKGVSLFSMKQFVKETKEYRLGYSYNYQKELLNKYKRQLSNKRPLTVNAFSIKHNINPATMALLIKNGAKKEQISYATKYSYKQRLDYYNEFQRRSSPPNQVEFCKSYNISSATLHRLLTYGPKKVEEPKSIQYFKLYHIQGMTVGQIAEKFNVSKQSVSQQLYKAKTKINEYFENQHI
ncbi:MAG: sigma factor-like helix-turn-helix DNA-binding protein [Bacteroidota bacterium]